MQLGPVPPQFMAETNDDFSSVLTKHYKRQKTNAESDLEETVLTVKHYCGKIML